MRQASVLVLLMAVVAVSGCVSSNTERIEPINMNTSDASINETGDQILESSRANFGNISSHRIQADGQMALDVTLFGLEIDMGVEDALDYRNSSSRAHTQGEVSVGAAAIGTNQTEFRTETYTNEDAAYVKKMNESVEDAEWRELNSSFENNPFRLGGNSFENVSAELVGTETVNGTEAYVLALDRDTSAVAEHLSQVFTFYGPELGDDTDSGNISEEDIETFQTYLWISQETRMPVKTSQYISMNTESEGGILSRFIDLDGSMQMKSEALYTEYDVEIDIETPDELN